MSIDFPGRERNTGGTAKLSRKAHLLEMLALKPEYSGSRLPFFVTFVRDPDGLSSAGLLRLFPPHRTGLVRFEFDLFGEVTHIEQILDP